jgi:DNA-binding XRE family transcriptional regulator
MATQEMVRSGKPENLQDRAMTMALAILVERIRSLPKDDKEDLYELMKEIPGADNEGLQDIAVGMLEILDQSPVTVRRMSCEETPIGNGLQKWIDYVSERIRSLRKAAGMTQEQLAEKSAIPQSHISRLEAGRHSPSRMTLEKIAAALGVEVAAFDPSA